MKQLVLTLVISFLVFVVIGLILKQTVFKPLPAGLQVKANVSSAVFINGKNVGQTPFEDKNLTAGEVTLKLVPSNNLTGSAPWETKIKLSGGTLTVVNREFGESMAASASEIITLEKLADKKKNALVLISQPDSAMVKINGEAKGLTPLSLDNLADGDWQLVVSAQGFLDRPLRVKLLPGFKLMINVKLAEASALPETQLTPTLTSTPEPSIVSTYKSQTSPTPTISKLSPTPTKVILSRPYVIIKNTPTGWLRVRSEPKTASSELGKVYPGESYSLLGEQVGWYKIQYQTEKAGWVSGSYASKVQ